MAKYKIGDIVMSLHEPDFFEVLDIERVLELFPVNMYLCRGLKDKYLFITFREESLMPYNMVGIWYKFWTKNG